MQGRARFTTASVAVESVRPPPLSTIRTGFAHREPLTGSYRRRSVHLRLVTESQWEATNVRRAVEVSAFELRRAEAIQQFGSLDDGDGRYRAYNATVYLDTTVAVAVSLPVLAGQDSRNSDPTGYRLVSRTRHRP